MTNYSILAKYRNRDQVDYLVAKLKEKGKTCYNFCETPPDKDNPNAHPEDQMRNFENTTDFYNDEHFKLIFQQDLEGLKNAEQVIVLLPAGNSVHIEAGIAYGLEKSLILIGKPEKPESLYLIFSQRFETVDDFLSSL